MATKKNGKKITIDGLAKIINDGFNGQMEYMGKRFDKVDERLNKIERQLINKTDKSEHEKLKGRVTNIEGLLAMPVKK